MSAAEDAEGWITAKEASARVGDGWADRGEIVAHAARPDVLASRARRAVTRRVGRRSSGQETARENFALPGAFWNTEDGDHERADWRSGRFQGGAGDLSITAYGVEFSRSDFDKIFPLDLAAAPERKDDAPRAVPSRGGAHPKNEAWVAMWHTIVELAAAGRLNIDCFGTIDSLVEEILVATNGALSKRTIYTDVSQVWRKFVQQ